MLPGSHSQGNFQRVTADTGSEMDRMVFRLYLGVVGF